jgi:hypothetical protein
VCGYLNYHTALWCTIYVFAVACTSQADPFPLFTVPRFYTTTI